MGHPLQEVLQRRSEEAGNLSGENKGKTKNLETHGNEKKRTNFGVVKAARASLQATNPNYQVPITRYQL